MKKTLVLAFLFAMASVMHAQNNSNFTISTTGTTNLKITFANKKYSLQDRSVTFQSLVPGNYALTIFQLRKKLGGGNEYITVFDKNVTLTSQKHLEVCVTRFGKVTFDEGIIESDEWNENYTNPPPVNNPYNNGSGNGRNNNNGNWAQPISSAQFTTIKTAVSSEYSDLDKLRLAKVALKNNLLSTAQIKELGLLFYSDMNKYEFAKYAYDSCVDKGNYFTLTELFYSSIYKRDLLDYISSH